jgi:hypothetical protein
MEDEQREIDLAATNDCLDKIHDFVVVMDKDFDLEIIFGSLHFYLVKQLKKNGLTLDVILSATKKMWASNELDN